jgi:hypothetical protein
MEDEKQDIEQWLAVRKEAALRINPKTADVFYLHGQVGNPYGVLSVPEEYELNGRCWFARAPCSDVWVSFDDLPDETLEALRARPEEHVTPPRDGFDRLAQSMLRFVRKFPNEIDEFGDCLKDLDSMVDEPLDEMLKTSWGNRCSMLERLVEVVKRKVEGRSRPAARVARRRDAVRAAGVAAAP